MNFSILPRGFVLVNDSFVCTNNNNNNTNMLPFDLKVAITDGDK